MIDLDAFTEIDTWTSWTGDVSIRFLCDGEVKKLIAADARAFLDAIEATGVDVTYLRDKLTPYK